MAKIKLWQNNYVVLSLSQNIKFKLLHTTIISCFVCSSNKQIEQHYFLQDQQYISQTQHDIYSPPKLEQYIKA